MDFILKNRFKNAYDVYLLSKQTNTKKSISKFKMLKNPLNCFLATCYVTFGNIESLQYYKTKEAENCCLFLTL